jgi:hypothetical protein
VGVARLSFHSFFAACKIYLISFVMAIAAIGTIFFAYTATQAQAQVNIRDIFPQGYDDGLKDGRNDIGNHTSYQGHCPQNIVQFSTYCTGYYIGYDAGYKGSNSTAAADALKRMQQEPQLQLQTPIPGVIP